MAPAHSGSPTSTGGLVRAGGIAASMQAVDTCARLARPLSLRLDSISRVAPPAARLRTVAPRQSSARLLLVRLRAHPRMTNSPANRLSLRALTIMVVVAAVSWVSLVGLATAGWLNLGGADMSLSLTFLWWAIAGQAAFWFAARPSRLEWLAWLGATALGTLALDVRSPQLGVNAVLIAGGLSAWAALGIRVLRRAGLERQRHLFALLSGTLMCLYILLSGFPLALSARLRPVTLDDLAYAGDGALGGQASFAVERLFAALPMLAHVCFHTYFGIPFALAGLLALQWSKWGWPTRHALLSVLVAGVAGHVMYAAFPLIGPKYVFGLTMDFLGPSSFPNPLPARLTMPRDIPNVPRNCMPSLHFAWALILYWQARALGRGWAAAGLVFAVLTALSTLGFALHYAVDLIAAVPYAVGIHLYFSPSTAHTEARRWRGIAVSAACFVGWLLLLRFGGDVLQFSVFTAWGLAILAALPPLYLEYRHAADIPSRL